MYSVLLVVSAKDNPVYLGQCLVSIKNQTLSPTEVLILANGELPFILDSIIKYYSQLLTVLITRLEAPVPFGTALNVLIRFSSQDVALRMDPDDIMLPIRAESQISYLHKHTSLAVLGSNAYLLSSGQPIIPTIVVPTGSNLLRNLWRNPLIHSSCALRLSLIKQSGFYRNLPRAQDFELWMRLASLDIKMDNLSLPLIYYRASSSSSKKSLKLSLFQLSVLFRSVFLYKLPRHWIILYLPVLFKPFLPLQLWRYLTRRYNK